MSKRTYMKSITSVIRLYKSNCNVINGTQFVLNLAEDTKCSIVFRIETVSAAIDIQL